MNDTKKLTEQEIVEIELMKLIKDDDIVTFYEDISIRKKMHNLRREIFPGEQKRMSESLTRGGGGVFGYFPEEDEGTYDKCHMHHESHVAQGLYTCPWKTNDDIVMVSIDGDGEEQEGMIDYVNKHDRAFKELIRLGWMEDYV